MTDKSLGVDPKFQIPDELWERIQALLPPPKAKKKPGRPRMDDRKAMTAIFYVLRTGCQWKALPRSLGAPSTVHEPTEEAPQHLCLDKGYDYPQVREFVAAWGYTAHIRTRGEEAQEKREMPGYRARRWVVERTHSWFNRFRRLLIRWEKKVENYLAMLHFACAWTTFQAARLFG